MFITDDDYKVVIGDKALMVISQATPATRQNAESEAEEEISSYLRPVYDVEAIFTATGLERNKLIVMYTVDIAVYHLTASMPQKMGTEIRQERYERAIKWLEGVQSGRIVPNLPRATTTDGKPIGQPIRFGADKPLRHNW